MRMAVELPGTPRRILIIKPSSLGDVVHALPVLKPLRRRWPEARISWLVERAFAGLLEGLRGLDEVIPFEKERFRQAWWKPWAAAELVRFVRRLPREGFDVVIDLQGLLRSGVLARLTGAAVRIGFANARELAWVFYTHRVPIETMEQHAVDRYLKVAAALGCEGATAEFEFPVSEEDRRHIDGLIPREMRFAVLMPGANWKSKRWPVERFAELAGALRRRFGLESVVAGGGDEAKDAQRVGGAVNLAGKTTLRQLVALLERAELVIANDSGPMHIAAALGRPLVAIYGPTNPLRTGPYGRVDSVVRAEVSCAPCYRRRCWGRRCMWEVGVEAVLAAAQSQLGKRPTSRGPDK
jgi:lipopolysaccharide heptosyltransferase I